MEEDAYESDYEYDEPDEERAMIKLWDPSKYTKALVESKKLKKSDWIVDENAKHHEIVTFNGLYDRGVYCDENGDYWVTGKARVEVDDDYNCLRILSGIPKANATC